MKKLLTILLADKNGHENAGRATHALLYTQQAEKEGIETKLIFDGGGTQWAVEMTKETSHFYNLYKELTEKGVDFGVCKSCAKAFKVDEELKTIKASFSDEGPDHPNIGKYLANGWDVITL